MFPKISFINAVNLILDFKYYKCVENSIIFCLEIHFVNFYLAHD